MCVGGHCVLVLDGWTYSTCIWASSSVVKSPNHNCMCFLHNMNVKLKIQGVNTYQGLVSFQMVFQHYNQHLVSSFYVSLF